VTASGSFIQKFHKQESALIVDQGEPAAQKDDPKLSKSAAMIEILRLFSQ
jgi:hypothetical protein